MTSVYTWLNNKWSLLSPVSCLNSRLGNGSGYKGFGCRNQRFRLQKPKVLVLETKVLVIKFNIAEI